LVSTGFSSAATVVRSDALRWLQRPGPDAEVRFDIAFVDPPYAFDDWPALLLGLPARMAVLESSRALETSPPWLTTRTRRHGDTVVTFARRN
ncbi:MAG: RsmD family RNA methyltransferase, partial [Actinomycetota bacterium]|nr:RsmD family RNA methyltransferase [Actinomycetota bacterium]